MSVSSKM